jgi:hypothetical protein
MSDEVRHRRATLNANDVGLVELALEPAHLVPCHEPTPSTGSMPRHGESLANGAGMRCGLMQDPYAPVTRR